MIQKIKAKMEAEAKWEQKSYDKYACWCEKTLEEKAKQIEEAKLRIKVIIKLITKLSMEIGICTADVKDHTKAILKIKSDIDTLVEQRSKKHNDWLAEKSEAEQYMGALEAAINVLSSATKADKGGIVEALQETKVLSVAAGLRAALAGVTSRGLRVPEVDMDLMRQFVSSPQDFLHPKAGDSSAFLQITNSNPFGDYQPKSGQIQGILKEMYDEYARSLERGSGEEAMDVKNFLRLKATKEEELVITKKALEISEKDCAEKEKERADLKLELTALKAKLKNLEKFFEETKAACKEKATMWSTRCRIRASEILGINKGLEILNSPEAQKTFQTAATTLLQVSSRSVSRKRGPMEEIDAYSGASGGENDAYSQLKALASKYNNIGLAQIAMTLKSGGHFDKVIAMVDKMIALLRKEGMDDIEHRDRCQSGAEKNGNDKADTENDIAKAKEELEIQEDKQTKTQQAIYALESEIKDTKTKMEERLDLRNEDEKSFKVSLRADADAVKLLASAIAAMSSWYKGEGKEHSKDFELLQQPEGEDKGPEYTIDKDKAPETNFGGEYNAKDSESGGIVAIIEMLKEDLEMEMKDSRAEWAESEAEYEKEMATMRSTLESQEAEKIALEKVLADTKDKIEDLEKVIFMKGEDLKGIKKMGAAIEEDCAWVATHFESRKEAREAEIDGLMEAKNILAGAE